MFSSKIWRVGEGEERNYKKQSSWDPDWKPAVQYETGGTSFHWLCSCHELPSVTQGWKYFVVCCSHFVPLLNVFYFELQITAAETWQACDYPRWKGLPCKPFFDKNKRLLGAWILSLCLTASHPLRLHFQHVSWHIFFHLLYISPIRSSLISCSGLW